MTEPINLKMAVSTPKASPSLPAVSITHPGAFDPGRSGSSTFRFPSQTATNQETAKG